MFHSVADEQIRFVILNQDPLPPPKQRFLKSALGMLLFFVTLILLVFIAVSGLFVYSVLTAPRECKLEEAKPAEKMTLEVTEKVLFVTQTPSNRHTFSTRTLGKTFKKVQYYYKDRAVDWSQERINQMIADGETFEVVYVYE